MPDTALGRRMIAAIARDQMHMDVKHALPGRRSAIDTDVVAVGMVLGIDNVAFCLQQIHCACCSVDVSAKKSPQSWEFVFVLGQARMEGAVQMIINPVAIR